MSNRSQVLVSESGLPRHEALRLLAIASGLSMTDLVIGVEVPGTATKVFETLVGRRMGGEPLQYIEGTVPFGPVELEVDQRVLVPRPETEELLEVVAQLPITPDVIIDLCTGSGNLAIALAAMHPDAEVHAVDISSEALAVAAANVARNAVTVHLVHGDLFGPLPERLAGSVDVIVANPPYLSEAEYESVPIDVRREPRGALVAGPRGTEVLERIASGAPRWLRPGGVIVCEISEFHGADALRFFDILHGRLLDDLSGKRRFVVGRRPFE